MKAKGLTRETVRSLGIYSRKFVRFGVGDMVAVSLKVKEGNKERIQIFQGDVIAIHKNGASSTFTVRRIGAHSVPVERVFPYYSPLVADVKFIRHGDVCRAKLYYIRDRIGKAALVKEKIMTKQEKEKFRKMLNEISE